MDSEENGIAGLDQEVAVLRRVEFRGRGCHSQRCGPDGSRGSGEDEGWRIWQAPDDNVIGIDDSFALKLLILLDMISVSLMSSAMEMSAPLAISPLEWARCSRGWTPD